MTFRNRLAAALAALAATLIAVAPAPAQAHSIGSFYETHWDDNASIEYGLNKGFPSGSDWRTRVLNGKTTWDVNGSGNEPNYFWTLADDIEYGSLNEPCFVPGLDAVVIHYADIDVYGVNTLAVTALCDNTSTRDIYTGTIVVDSSRSNWYVGTGTVPAGKADLWSVMSHEWGHVGGWHGHIPEGDLACPETSARSTMCPTTPLATLMMRDLATHDIHTWDAAY